MGCITFWYGTCSASDHKALQRVMGTAQYNTGAKLPAIQYLYTRRCQRKVLKLSKTPATLVIDCSLCYRMASRYRSSITWTPVSAHIDSVPVLSVYSLYIVLLFYCCSLTSCYLYFLFLFIFLKLHSWLGACKVRISQFYLAHVTNKIGFDFVWTSSPP
jgi:hypothetical protein